MKSKINSFVCLLVIILIWVSAAVAQPQPRIINGTKAAPGAYPWMAALLYSPLVDLLYLDSTEAHFCGGTLIGPQTILTAAHCVTDFSGFAIDPSFIQVLVGTNSLPNDFGPRLNIVGIKVHPAFNSITLENDFALIKIASTVAPPYMEVAGIAESNLYAGGAIGKILGWGVTNPSLPILPVDLHEAEIPMFNDSDCLDMIGRWFKPNSMLCAGQLESSPGAGDGVDSCFGDSGGPLFVNDGGIPKQVGTVSWGFGCAGTAPAVYGEVARAESFIKAPLIIAPVAAGFPFISGIPEVGQTVSCDGASFQGDPATSIAYDWFRVNSTSFSTEFLANGQTYTLTEADAGQYVQCGVFASNQGGFDSQYSDLVLVQGAPLPPITSPIDFSGPSISKLALTCSKKRCRLLTTVTDDLGDNNISRVEARIVIGSKPNCLKKGKPNYACVYKSGKKVNGHKISGSVWSIPFNVNNGRGKTAYIAVDAFDTSGNPAVRILTASKKLN